MVRKKCVPKLVEGVCAPPFSPAPPGDSSVEFGNKSLPRLIELTIGSSDGRMRGEYSSITGPLMVPVGSGPRAEYD